MEQLGINNMDNGNSLLALIQSFAQQQNQNPQISQETSPLFGSNNNGTSPTTLLQNLLGRTKNNVDKGELLGRLAGQAAGTFFGGPVGGRLGSAAGSFIGSKL